MTRRNRKTAAWRKLQLVYFAASACGQYLKIGASLAPSLRMQQLLSEGIEGKTFPRGVRAVSLLATTRGGYDLEQRLHYLFGPWHVCGEWFEFKGPLLDYVQALVEKNLHLPEPGYSPHNRTAHLTVPLSPEERAEVKHRADAAGLAEATWVRVHLLAAQETK